MIRDHAGLLDRSFEAKYDATGCCVLISGEPGRLHTLFPRPRENDPGVVILLIVEFGYQTIRQHRAKIIKNEPGDKE